MSSLFFWVSIWVRGHDKEREEGEGGGKYLGR